jgi:hypothetical protein
MRKILAYVGLMFLVVAAARAATGQHTVAVTLNYDFTTDGACSTTVTKGCLQQFNIYDVTTGTPVKLFSITAPAGANGPVNGITGTSGQLSLTVACTFLALPRKWRMARSQTQTDLLLLQQRSPVRLQALVSLLIERR